MQIVSFVNPKGGSGKTTAASVLASCLMPKFRIALVDTAPEQHLSDWSQQVCPALVHSISFNDKMGRIDACLEEMSNRFDCLIIDTQSTANRTNSIVMAYSDLVLVPTEDEENSANGAIEALAEFSRQVGNGRFENLARLLFCRTKQNLKANHQKSVNDQMRQNFRTLSVELHCRDAYACMVSTGRGLHGLVDEDVAELAAARENAAMYANEVQSLLQAYEVGLNT